MTLKGGRYPVLTHFVFSTLLCFDLSFGFPLRCSTIKFSQCAQGSVGRVHKEDFFFGS